MEITCAITSSAFFASAFSPILPIKALGLYGGIFILVSYLVIIVMFPPMIVIHEKYLSKRACCSKKNNNVYAVDSIIMNENASERFFGGFLNTMVRKLRWLFIIVFLGWTGYAGYIAKDIETVSER